jgi:hypothetical protein
MRKFSDKPEVQERFNKLEANINATLKQLPPLEEIHDPNKPGATAVAAYDVRAYAFLEEYKKDLDIERCVRTLGIKQKEIQAWLDQPKFTDVMNRIHDSYADAVLMDSKTIAGWSVEILRDLHQRFKDGDSKASSALATMAGNMLRASGNFKDANVNSPQVLIQINTTGAVEPKIVSPDQSQEPPTDTIAPKPAAESSINISIKQNNDKERISRMSILCGT